MKVVVIGAGYVGYPMALLMAKAGHDVVGMDIDPEVIRIINSGDVHLPEPGLRELAHDPEVRKRMRGSTSVEPADVFMICVPTPLKKPRKVAELSMVEDATRDIVPHIKKGNLVVLESTVPPRCCRELMTPILEKSGLKVGKDILLAHCPERVLPGRALEEILNNARIIGGVDEASTEMAARLYASFVKGQLVKTDDITAELCKLMENTYRDVNIALANEFSRVCRTLGIDVNNAISIANLHPRVDILRPGIGVGGHCIPIDPWFIAEVDPESCRIIPIARQINDAQPEFIAKVIRKQVRELADPKIVCLGATYKPDIYDLREAPAAEVVHLLREDGYNTEVFDPITREHGGRTLEAALKGADLAVVLVPHQMLLDEIKNKRAALGKVMAHNRIVDVSKAEVVELSVGGATVIPVDLHRVWTGVSRRAQAVASVARVLTSEHAGVRITGSLEKVEVALVNNVTPPVTSGYCLILEELLGSMAPERIAVVTNTRERWGTRAHVLLESGNAYWMPPRQRLWPWDAVIQAERLRLGKYLAAKMPKLRSVLSGFNRYMGLAKDLAQACNAKLWIYAIDDHTIPDNPFMRHARAEALNFASRNLALSEELGTHLQQRYGLGKYDVLPPLIRVPSDTPRMPVGPRQFVFIGNLMPYHLPAMRVMAEVALKLGNLELVAVLPTASHTAGVQLLPVPWRLISGAHNRVLAQVGEAHVGVILLDLEDLPEAGMTVAFPTKLRDYAAAGRPILALAPTSSCVSRVVEQNQLGWRCSTLAELADTVRHLAHMPDEELVVRGRRAHAFALQHLNVDTVGHKVVDELLPVP